MVREEKIKSKPWFVYKYGLYVLAAGFILLAFYLITFIANPIIYPLFGPEGPELLYAILNTFLISSVFVFGIGLLLLVIGLFRNETVKRSWLVVVFIAPTFFVMAAIVFTPLIQGITFSFTDADQKNMSKLQPTIVTKKVGNKTVRTRVMKVVPSSFKYNFLDNYWEILSGSSKAERENSRLQKEQVESLIQKMAPIPTAGGNQLLVFDDLLFFTPELFALELESKFAKKNGFNGGLISFKNLSTDKTTHFEVIISGQTDWRRFIETAFLPKWELPRFYKVFLRSIVWTVANVFFHFFIGLGLALLLNRKIFFRAGYRLLLLLPWGVPSVVSAFSWRWLFNQEYGLINAVIRALGGQSIAWLSNPYLMLVAAIVTNIWLGFPFMTVALLGGLQTIPKELYESARVDGATAWQQFFHITMPMLKPVALTVTLLGTIWTFNMFNVIFLVTQQSMDADILVTYAFRAFFFNWNIGISAAYSVIILIILMIFSYSYWKVLKGQQEVR